MRIALILIAVMLAGPAIAQDVSVDLGEGVSFTNRSVQLFVLVTVLSLVPAIAIMFTCFPFMVTVLSILKQGIGLQAAPPNMLIVSLALFLTYYVMEPVFTAGWDAGIAPLVAEELSLEEAFPLAIAPFRGFMAARVDPETFANLADLRPDLNAVPGADAPLSVLMPSFLLSEVSRAFQVGFMLFLPFLIIDLVVAAVLMSMGMMMVPPAIVALPFKLGFFVVADGWSLIAGALVSSYS
ncbi:MAG: flagellar biosynthetic protein FliP [Rhodobacterales bacterium]|nr:MAG: flagellar biosynthetic protein FliP [Rhodobacterales bacterium]